MNDWWGEVALELAASGDAHALHAYFNTCPESPDGRRLLLVFRSARPDARHGEIGLIDLADGSYHCLVPDVTVEDAHRQACQQWADGGRCVVYHDMRGERAVVCRADVGTGEIDEMAEGRQVGFCAGAGPLVPLHGPHWAPGQHRDLELLDVRSGQVRVALTLDEAVGGRELWADELLGGPAASIFFPVLSPDGMRVFFKLSAPETGRFRDPRGSRREGLLVYDFKEHEVIYRRDRWGHPAWFADSRRIINTPNTIIDVEAGEGRVLDALPAWRGVHPAMAPGGRLMVADTVVGPGDAAECWLIVLADVETQRWRRLHTGSPPRAGTKSWRPAHPHPVFSRDGRRIYFNLNLGDRTAVHVLRPVA